MIIHASLQTDISQFYTEWLFRRLKEGFVEILGEKTIQHYDFKKNKLSKVFLWTRDPQNILKRYKELQSQPYNYEVITEFTLYDKCYEPKIKSKNRIMNDVRKLSNKIGRDKVAISYGPIFYTFNCDKNWHIHQFKFFLEELHYDISKIYIDFNISNNCLNANNYGIRKLTKEEENEIIQKLKEIAEKYHRELLIKPSLNNLKEDEIDIGEINTCPAACMYCIGINNKKAIKSKNGKHNPQSSLLIGNPDYDSKIQNIVFTKKEEKKEDNFSLFDF